MFVSVCALANRLDSLRLRTKNEEIHCLQGCKQRTIQSLATYYQVEELSIMRLIVINRRC
jgi:hypothetical protein